MSVKPILASDYHTKTTTPGSMRRAARSDLAAMPTAATNDWLASAYSGFVLTLPGL